MGIPVFPIDKPCTLQCLNLLLLPEQKTISLKVIIIIFSDNHDARILKSFSFNRDFYHGIGISYWTQELANLDHIYEI